MHRWAAFVVDMVAGMVDGMVDGMVAARDAARVDGRVVVDMLVVVACLPPNSMIVEIFVA